MESDEHFHTVRGYVERKPVRAGLVERLGLVMEWHGVGLLPWSGKFIFDPRLTILHDDFFARVAGRADARYDAILIDIDDAPSLPWHESHAGFYKSTGLEGGPRTSRPGRRARAVVRYASRGSICNVGESHFHND